LGGLTGDWCGCLGGGGSSFLLWGEPGRRCSCGGGLFSQAFRNARGGSRGTDPKRGDRAVLLGGLIGDWRGCSGGGGSSFLLWGEPGRRCSWGWGGILQFVLSIARRCRTRRDVHRLHFSSAMKCCSLSAGCSGVGSAQLRFRNPIEGWNAGESHLVSGQARRPRDSQV
jgi:hypothetical protein